LHLAGEDLVHLVTVLVLQGVAEVVVDGRRVRPVYREVVARVEVETIASVAAVDAFDRAIEPADRAAFCPQQFLREDPRVQTVMVPFDHIGSNARVGAEPSGHGLAFFGCRAVAFHQEGGVLRHRERFHLIEELVHGGVPRLVHLAVVIGRGREAGEEEAGRQVVPFVAHQGLEVHHRADEHDTVEVHAVAVLQVARKPGGTCGPVTLPGQELRR
jgi:hypothetical protein